MRANQRQNDKAILQQQTNKKKRETEIKSSSHTHVTICLDLVPHHTMAANRIKMKSNVVDVVRVCQQNMCYNTRRFFVCVL